MLMKKKGIPDKTMMSLITKLLKRDTTTKGFKIKGVDGVQPVAYSEVVQFAERLTQLIAQGEYAQINKCDTCGNFDAAPRSSKGCCFPKNPTCSRTKKDYCSNWIPMDESQKYFRRKIHELQTKRAGDGSEDSTQGD